MQRIEWCEPCAAATFEPLEPRLLLSAGTATDEALAELARGNNAFAIDLYQALRGQQGNLFFSPFSISAALSMTYAGAAGQTAQQMADVLHITQPGPVHHATFGELIARLSRDDGGPATGETDDGSDGDEFTLRIANSLWGQTDYPFLSPFLQTLEGEYGSPLRPTNFRWEAEESRKRINGWVSDNTNDRIPELIPEGAITDETLLVLANAIYFNASWQCSFPTEVEETFHLPAGDLDVEMMRQTESLQYLDGDGYRAVQLPYYDSDAAMMLIVPDEGQFESFEASFSVDRLDGIVSGLRGAEVRLTMPKFECRQKAELGETLQQMGMTDAFDPDLADFTGMSETALRDELRIDKVIHEAWLSVDEDGTEAAAATAVFMCFTSTADPSVPPPPIEFTVDRPFLYLIRDTQTGTTLFLGRINDAAAFGESEGDAQHGHDDDDDVPQSPRPDPTLPFPVRGPVQVSLASLGAEMEQRGGGQAGPDEIANFRQSLVTLPRLTEPAARRLLGAHSLRWRRAAAGIADEGYVKIDALDLHPARQSALPDWMVGVLNELNGKAVLLGIRGDAL